MAPSIPSRIGRYEIKARLGSGGMGEVFRGRDDKLGRDVAIKVILEAVSNDPERLKRFEREAKTLAQLSHPNVAQIHGFESDGERHFLVLELVEGESLGERIHRGPIEVSEAIDLTRQMAEGLEAIHDAGLVHRDLKPANVRITPGGVVKILDFGLAKAMADGLRDESGGTFAISLATDPGGRPASSIASSDSFSVTADGAVLGTPVYMSPEQVRGKSIDRRADIWAFGCVLLECLTGRRAFSGDTAPEVFAAIVGKAPDFASLPAGTPRRVRELLERCLEKDPRIRLRDAGEARIALSRARDEPTAVETPVRDRARGWRLLAAGATAVAITCGALALKGMRADEPGSGPGVEAEPRVAVIPGAGSRFYIRFAVSPDGTRLVHGSDDPGESPTMGESERDRRLFLTKLTGFESAPIEGTENAANPFFSPDGVNLGFVDKRALKLVVMPVSGGIPRAIGSVDQAAISTWTPDGSILTSRAIIDGKLRPGIVRVFPDGRAPVAITTPNEGESSHFGPVLLPGSGRILFSVEEPNGFSIASADLDTGKHRILMPGVSPTLVPTGHLVFFDPQHNRLMATRFDSATATASGPVRPVVDGVGPAVSDGNGSYAISGDGTLFYTRYDHNDLEGGELQVLEPGKPAVTIAGQEPWAEPSWSPDGRKVLVRKVGRPECSLWVFDVERGAMTRITSQGDAHGPIWHPDGRRVICNLEPLGVTGRQTVILPIDGSAPPAPFHRNVTSREHVTSISTDGKTVAFSRVDGKNGWDVWTESTADGDARPFAASPYNDTLASFSPDGKWVAYITDETGRWQVYARAYPEGGARYPVSTTGGRQPRWSRDGRKLFYSEGRTLYTVDVDTSQGFVVGKPRVFLEGKRLQLGMGYAISADGNRALVVVGTTDPPAVHDLRVVYHWTRELTKAR